MSWAGLGNLGEQPIPNHGYVIPGAKTPHPTAHVVYGPGEINPANSGCDDQAEWLLNVLAIAFRENLQVSELSPHTTPPFRAIDLNRSDKMTILPLAPTADASIAASNLALIDGTNPASTNSEDVITFTVPNRHIAIINLFGVTYGDAGAERDVSIQIRINGATQTDFGNTGVPVADAGDPESVFVTARGNEIITVSATNSSTIVPHTVCARLKGWIFPVQQNVDSLNSWLLREERKKGCLR